MSDKDKLPRGMKRKRTPEEAKKMAACRPPIGYSGSPSGGIPQDNTRTPEFERFMREEFKPPLWDGIVANGKQDDYVWQALAYMGNASHMMSWANNALEDKPGIPVSIVRDMLDVTQKIHDIQEELRKWNKHEV